MDAALELVLDRATPVRRAMPLAVVDEAARPIEISRASCAAPVTVADRATRKARVTAAELAAVAPKVRR